MTEFKRDVVKLQTLISESFTKTGALAALADGGRMNPAKLQKTVEHTAEYFESAVLELRRLLETWSPGVGGYGKQGAAPAVKAAGHVEQIGYGWLHIRLNTLLPHCRYQTPAWLTDTLRRLLDEFEAAGNELPYYRQALMVIDEHSDIQGRHVYDQDNKGWKAVGNALKGRVLPDDDQYTLAVALVSSHSPENCCHITLMELQDAADFFALHAGDYAVGDVYTTDLLSDAVSKTAFPGL